MGGSDSREHFPTEALRRRGASYSLEDAAVFWGSATSFFVIVNAVGAGIGLFPIGIAYGADLWGRTVFGSMAGAVLAALCISVELEAIPEAHANVLAPRRLAMLSRWGHAPRLGALQRSLCSDESRTAPGPLPLRKSFPRRVCRALSRSPTVGSLSGKLHARCRSLSVPIYSSSRAPVARSPFVDVTTNLPGPILSRPWILQVADNPDRIEKESSIDKRFSGPP